MNITSAQYIKVNNANDNIKIIVDSTEMSVPIDPANRHYQAIQEWVKEGNKIEEAD